MSSDNQIFKYLISTLILLGVCLFIGGGLLVIMVHPDWFPAPETEQLADSQALETGEAVIDGLDTETGFVAKGEYLLVKQTCTACHSSKLVTQNRATREGWLDMIRWMQETQKLWDLGENEDKILTYLATHYGPDDQGRRAPLEIENWEALPVTAPPRGQAHP